VVDQHAGHLAKAILACYMQRCVVEPVALVDIGVVINQHAGHLAMAIDACQMQRCVVEPVALVDIGVVVDQHAGHLDMAVLACPMQRCAVVVVVAMVDIGVVSNKRSYSTGISCGGCIQQPPTQIRGCHLSLTVRVRDEEMKEEATRSVWGTCERAQ
jgi:hypothetical protein